MGLQALMYKWNPRNEKQVSGQTLFMRGDLKKNKVSCLKLLFFHRNLQIWFLLVLTLTSHSTARACVKTAITKRVASNPPISALTSKAPTMPLVFAKTATSACTTVPADSRSKHKTFLFCSKAKKMSRSKTQSLIRTRQQLQNLFLNDQFWYIKFKEI